MLGSLALPGYDTASGPWGAVGWEEWGPVEQGRLASLSPREESGSAVTHLADSKCEGKCVEGWEGSQVT